MAAKEIEKIPSHYSEAKERLPEYARTATKSLPVPWSEDEVNSWEALLHAFCQPAEDIETIMIDMLNKRGLNTGSGEALDRIGEIVGIARGTSDDLRYRVLLAAQITSNSSSGSQAALAEIYKAVTGLDTVTLYEAFPAGFYFGITSGEGVSTPENVALVVNAAKAAGVRYRGALVSPLPYFGFDSDLSPNASGFSVTPDGGVVEDPDFPFASQGATTSNKRVSIRTNGSPSTTQELVFTGVQLPIMDDFRTYILGYINGAPTRSMSIQDGSGNDWVFVVYNTTAYNLSLDVDDYSVAIKLLDTTAYAMAYKNGVRVPLTSVSTDFVEYLDTDKATYDLNNPIGLIENETRTPDYAPFDYSQAFSSETILGNIVSSSVVLMFVQPNSTATNQLLTYLDNFNAEDGYISLVDSAGVTWEFIRNTPAGTYTGGAGGNLPYIQLETGGSWPTPGTPTCQILKDGVAVTQTDFMFQFAKWDIGQSALFQSPSGNPEGLIVGKMPEPTPPEEIEEPVDTSGFYPVLFD